MIVFSYVYDSKKTKIIKLGAVITTIVILNPIPLYVYLVVFLNHRQINKDQPEIESNFASLKVPDECTLMIEQFQKSFIDSRSNIRAVYKCDSEAQAVRSEILNKYTSTDPNVLSSSSAFVVGPYVFGLFTNEAAAKNDREPYGVALPATRPTYLSVSIFSN